MTSMTSMTSMTCRRSLAKKLRNDISDVIVPGRLSNLTADLVV